MMRTPVSQADTGTSSNVNEMMGRELRIGSFLVATWRARKRDSFPDMLAYAEPAKSGERDSALGMPKPSDDGELRW
jgi:hypothetical protein